MKTISFAWDKKKAETNQEKHKISFEEAQTVFSDPNAYVEVYGSDEPSSKKSKEKSDDK